MASVANANQSNEPEPETLNPRAEDGTVVKDEEDKATHKAVPEAEKEHHRAAYRPSHKATFISLGVVIVILAINAGVIAFVIKSQSSKSQSLTNKSVSISSATLSKLGVNSSQLGNTNEQLTVDPYALFNSGLTVAGDVKIGGQLHINSTFNANNAILTQLQAGNTSISALNVNGNTTESNLSLRGSLAVSGTATFQNTLTVGQILSVDNNAAINNNLSVGGNITTGSIATSNLIATGSIVFANHLQTSGTAPSVGPGSALGSNGTTSISGNDSAGTIDINIGTGAVSGVLVRVAFHSNYASTPRILITPIGIGANFYITSPSVGGFNIDVGSGLPPGGYAIDYYVID